MRAGLGAGDAMSTMKAVVAWMVVDVSSRADVDGGRWRTSWRLEAEARKRKLERD